MSEEVEQVRARVSELAVQVQALEAELHTGGAFPVFHDQPVSSVVPTGSEFAPRGTAELYKVIAARYWTEAGDLVAVGGDATGATLQATWDWARFH